ncbi:uncharacterized protein LOC131224213 [Magnolia sinica]|uniref:uncharacterized protein LOC131224213 n=1 Tax=Magnolia sinica TaxID=86752 RepID=UPI00265A6BB8|nr:uncharacterized protein LOC131224213 [Magnolia sinica]
MKLQCFSLTILDSLGGMGKIGMQQMGLQARLTSQAVHKMSGNASKAGFTLIFLNQIRYKVMIKNLEQVVTMVLNQFSDPHPRVRWAAINANGQLSTDLGLDLQVQYHQWVLHALASICSEEYNRPTCMLLGVQAELSVIVLDMTMILGIAHGLLLFGLDLFICVFLSPIDAVLFPLFITLLMRLTLLSSTDAN